MRNGTDDVAKMIGIVFHLDGGLIRNRPHCLRGVVGDGDGAGFAGEDRDALQVHPL
jgi:hypothetical protein